ncbi:MAG: hypothetical protein N4A61_11960 [Pelagimonas sp.]|nr:hypothetical protein [Pelagimonas sp.]
MPILSSDQLASLIALLHDLHRGPEISGKEAQTARITVEHLKALGADQM